MTLRWAESLGGLSGLVARVDANMAALTQWVEQTAWVDFLCADKANRSPTSVCLKIAGLEVAAMDAEASHLAKRIATMLENEAVAYDIGAYRDAPAGLRIWAGATVETSDLQALTPCSIGPLPAPKQWLKDKTHAKSIDCR